jgi:hypothetical protein
MKWSGFIFMILGCMAEILAAGDRKHSITADALLDPSTLTMRQQLRHVEGQLEALRNGETYVSDSKKMDTTDKYKHLEQNYSSKDEVKRKMKTALSSSQISERIARHDSSSFDDTDSVGGMRMAVFLATVAAMSYLVIINSIHCVTTLWHS